MGGGLASFFFFSFTGEISPKVEIQIQSEGFNRQNRFFFEKEEVKNPRFLLIGLISL